MTQDQYNEGLLRLQQLKPDHPLLPAAARGYNVVNCKYLSTALSSIKEDVPESQLPEQLHQLQIMRSQLYTQRAMLSNSFHNCTSDDERCEISKQIEALQEEKIIPVKRAIAHLKNGSAEMANVALTGPAASEGIVTMQELPTDPVQLKNRLLTLRSQISNKKALIRAAMSTPNKRAKKSITTHEEELRLLELNKSHVERAITASEAPVQ